LSERYLRNFGPPILPVRPELPGLDATATPRDLTPHEAIPNDGMPPNSSPPETPRAGGYRPTDASGAPAFRVEAPAIALPKGGGALKGIDETFAVNPSNGTASLSIPLPFTSGRAGVVPPLSLEYDSGAGSSVVGLGWSLAVAAISRRTDRRLPTYDDRDVFVFQGREDLVPAATWDGSEWDPWVPAASSYRVRRYRPRVERDFARVELCTDDALGSWWRVTTPDNVTTFFGVDAATRIADPSRPDDSTRVFSWLPACTVDDKGNAITYEWVAEDLAGVSPSSADANRASGIAAFTNRVLKRVRYGNRTPVFVDDHDPYRPPLLDGAFLFETVFDYGEHDPVVPTPDPATGRVWSSRPDPFSTYRSGFDVRTYRLVQRILMFHRFDELNGGDATLVRSLDLTYACPDGEVSHLASATLRGYVRKPDGTLASESLPPLELEYEPAAWDHTAHAVDPADAPGVPVGLNGQYQFVDLYGEGLAGVFSEHAGAWYYSRNLGDVGQTGKVAFEPPRPVAPVPSLSGVGRGVVQVQDLDGNGQRHVVVRAPELAGFYAPIGEDGWQNFVAFPNWLRIDLHDRHVRSLDLVGDGRAHLLVSEQDAFVWYRSLGVGGHEPGGRTVKPSDEERGPNVVFADETQSVFLADMSGDGLVDVVRVRNGEVCYWPNLGYGRFGTKVRMDNTPRVDEPDSFDAARVRLADVTGTGTSDLVYGRGVECAVWVNSSGNRFGDAQTFRAPLSSSAGVDLLPADLLGNGTTCLVWSSSLPGDAGAPMRYVDPMAAHKPHLLRAYADNLGKRVDLTYASSTWFRRRDEQNGRPWRTRLPFPVHCVRSVETRDLVAGIRVVSEYRYHHGYFDPIERELRGFGMVEQTDATEVEQWATANGGTLVDDTWHCPPTLTKTWFHLGTVGDDGTLLSRRTDEHWDALMRGAGFAVAVDEPKLHDGRVVAGPSGPANLVDALSAAERREAVRACKGSMLRREVFALDAPPNALAELVRRELSPFSVVTSSYEVTALQPALTGQHAVFSIHETESLTLDYERVVDDPRAMHRVNVRVDEVGKVRESAAIAYARKVEDPDAPQSVRDAQARTWITYETEEYTADVDDPVNYRLRQPSRSTAFAIRGLTATGELFSIEDFERDGFHALVDTTAVDPWDDQVPPPGQVTRRLLRASQTRYLDQPLTGARPLHEPDARGLVHQRHELAFTAGQVAHIYDGRVGDDLLVAGGYLHLDDADWWVPSGRRLYLGDGETPDDAASRFFTPVGHRDQLGVQTTVQYQGDTWLMRSQVQDAAGNQTRADAFDFRTCTPVRTIDANVNIAAVQLDALGRVKAVALQGKGDEADSVDGITGWTTPEEAADVVAFFSAESSAELAQHGATLLGNATARYVYDPHAFAVSGGTAPPVAATIARERHAAEMHDSPLQIGFEYRNGSRRVELHKVQAEAGVARRTVVHDDGTITVESIDTSSLAPPQLRWLGSGRQVRDEKGRVVKEYEPFFSTTPHFENAKELVETGVAHLRTYDPLDRLVRVDHPDGTFARVEPGAWATVELDRNDTVTDSDWYRRRINHEIDTELIAQGKNPTYEAQAAQQTEPHARTPFTRHLDALGRPVCEVQDAGLDAANMRTLLATAYARDDDGRLVSAIDPRGVVVATYARDLRGQLAACTTADGGTRWMLDDVRGQPLRSWDERGHTFVFSYDDPLGRLTSKRVLGGDGPTALDHMFERRIYGEGLPGDTTVNLRTHVAVAYDTAGRSENIGFDFKGNLVSSARTFSRSHSDVPNWDTADPDAALAATTYTSAATFDALGRVIERATPDGSVFRPTYNAANLLETMTVTQHGTDVTYVNGVDYDELGRRRQIIFGNGVSVTYAYDAETFRLLRLTTRDGLGVALEDLRYTYDPEGNITHLEDACVPTVWFANQMVTGLSRYTYDPLYRLLDATGREHVAQNTPVAADNWHDTPFLQTVGANDALAWRTYEQRYTFDGSSNLVSVEHQADAGSWTRTADYAPDSNRLLATHVGGTDYVYSSHPAHGYLTSMSHLSLMRWGIRDELQAVATQVVNAGTPETTWYAYDGDGKRVRKVVDRAAAEGADPVVAVERCYLDGVEIAVEYDPTGAPLVERHTLHVEDGRQRVALIETEHDPGIVTPKKTTVRYQSPDHVGSSQIETDETGTVISYEVYHPFGTTAYQATAHTLGSPAKRYRYTGMERDDESGLGYHGARYYAPWLGRWIAPDTHPDRLDGNRYAYVKNNPMIYRDPNGLFEEPVHGALTYRLAIAAGFSQQDAAEIAIAAAGMDHNAKTRPGDDLGEMQLQILAGRTQLYHYPSQEEAKSRVDRDISEGVSDLSEFGQHLHSLEDVGFKDAPGPHDRSPVRLLAPAVLTVSAVAIAAGVGLAYAADAAFKAGGGWSVLGALAVAVTVAAFAFALYGIVFAIIGAGTGHPTYKTERGGWSNFWSHAADRAFSDPDANTREMWQVYQVLKQAARAHDANAKADDAEARAAIKQTVEANTSAKINDLFNEPVRDPHGNWLPSYSEIRTRAPWQNRPPDVSLTDDNHVKFIYSPMCLAPRAR
jgi:RHS repeat-associated protein